jgi:hypothetical protein
MAMGLSVGHSFSVNSPVDKSVFDALRQNMLLGLLPLNTTMGSAPAAKDDKALTTSLAAQVVVGNEWPEKSMLLGNCTLQTRA